MSGAGRGRGGPVRDGERMPRGDRVAIAAAAGYSALLLAKAALAAVAVARRRARLRAATGAVIPPSELTIVQAIRSGDPQLEDALACTLVAAPRSAVIWLVDEEDATGRRAAEAARSRHPLARLLIVECPPCPPGVAPKTVKLHLAEPRIETEAFAVVDDDTSVSPEGVNALLDGLRIADVSTGLPCYVPGPGPWSRLLAQFVNDQGLLAYLPTAALGSPRALNGMTWAMRRSTLERLGGFGPLLPLLADDLAVATRVRTSGGTIDQTEVAQSISTTVADGRHYRELMHRWMVFAGLALRAERPARRAGLLAAYAVPAMLLGALVIGAARRPTPPRIAALGGALALRSAVLAVAQRLLTGRMRHDPVLSLVAELAVPAQFAGALVDRRIVWRGRRYRVHANDRFEEVVR